MNTGGRPYATSAYDLDTLHMSAHPWVDDLVVSNDNTPPKVLVSVSDLHQTTGVQERQRVLGMRDHSLEVLTLLFEQLPQLVVLLDSVLILDLDQIAFDLGFFQFCTTSQQESSGGSAHPSQAQEHSLCSGTDRNTFPTCTPG